VKNSWLNENEPIQEKSMHNPTKLPSAEPESLGVSTEGLAGIDQLMQQHVDAGDIQGGVTLVARRGHVVHFATHGEMDVEKGRAMEPDAIFIMASSAKPVIATGMLMLVDEGLVSLSDPVSEYIPEFSDMQVAVLDQDQSEATTDADEKPAYNLEPAQTPLTIHHLLTHTSGLCFMGPVGEVWTSDEDTLTTFASKIAAAPLNFQPGSQWNYGNSGIHGLSSRLIEVISGSTFDDFMQERLFDPLSMNDSYFDVPPKAHSQRVQIKGFDFSMKKKGWGLSSSAEDFLHFNQMLLNGGELFGQRILEPATVKKMRSNQVGDLFMKAGTGAKSQHGMGFGYAVAVTMDPVAARNHRGKGSFGWGGAGGTQSWADPEHELVAVRMMQQEKGGDFQKAVADALIN
tara:strand:+ start:363 stop:1565 length:1203 start_codon:yes stop_codon:yes gene_type:complete